MRAHSINADLHCHSSISDGTLAPAAVVERAHRNGVSVLALTDHDEVAGLVEAQQRATALGIAFVPGVEVSVTWAGATIHIVGLRIDAAHPTLVAGLAQTRDGRDVRAQAIAAELQAVGVPEAYRGALGHAGNPALLSRSHFARHLVETGVCADMRDAFARFLVAGKPGYVPHQWAHLSDALSWIHAAGGTAVMAHPGRYRLTETARHVLLTEFCEAGGQAIEVVCGSHTPDQYREFAELAQRFGLRASRGSDFHDPDESRHDLGTLPDLPATLCPVWHDWPELAGFLSR